MGRKGGTISKMASLDCEDAKSDEDNFRSWGRNVENILASKRSPRRQHKQTRINKPCSFRA